MSFQTKIQTLATSHTDNAGHTVQSACDWANSVNYQIGAPLGTSDIYVTKVSMNDGSEIATIDATVNWSSPFHEYPINLDANGLYVNASGNASQNLIQANTGTLAQSQVFNSGIIFPQGTISPITATDTSTWLLITGTGKQGFQEVFTCVKSSTTPMVIWGPGSTSFSNFNGAGCTGQAGQGIGFVVSGDDISSPTAGGLRLYKVNVNAGSQAATLLSTTAASTIDAGWTVAGQNGILLDQTDHNPIVFCQGQVSAANPFYMIKFNASTGAIIWSLSIPGEGGGNMASQSQIKSQKYVLIRTTGSGTNNGTVIDTNSGTITSTITTGLSGLTPFGSQCFNDQSGAIVGEYNYTGGADSPIPLNSTPTPFEGWGVLYIVPAANPTPATGTHASYTRVWGHLTS